MNKTPQWSEVFNTTYKQWNGIESVSAAAKNASYPFYVWNGIIYNVIIILTLNGGLTEKIGLKRKDNMPRPPLTFDLIQHLAADWQKKNFGEPIPHQALLGLSEEVGELCHAHLKGEQKIYHTPEKVVHMKKDAVGDIVIFLANYCNSQNFSFDECVIQAWDEIKNREYEHT